MVAKMIMTRIKNNFTNKSFQLGLITTFSMLQLHSEHTNVITVSQLGRKPKIWSLQGEEKKSYLSRQWLANTLYKQHS